MRLGSSIQKHAWSSRVPTPGGGCWGSSPPPKKKISQMDKFIDKKNSTFQKCSYLHGRCEMCWCECKSKFLQFLVYELWWYFNQNSSIFQWFVSTKSIISITLRIFHVNLTTSEEKNYLFYFDVAYQFFDHVCKTSKPGFFLYAVLTCTD